MSDLEYQSTSSEWAAGDGLVEQDLRASGSILEDTVSSESSRSQITSIAMEILETLVLTLVIFLLIRTVVQNFRIDGNSMEPNFHDGQYLLINKLAYRFGEPQRGDVVVFRYPRDPSRDFIKRVIGLPGETIEIRGEQVFADGVLVEEPFGPNEGRYDAGPKILGPDEVYVLGDNRDHSSDSHQWGPLSLDHVIGKAVVIYWPYESWGLVPRYSLAD